jgi:hypothetical protein
MNSLPRITEINISRQARALAWLRLTDYALVVLCGFWAISWLSELVINFPSDDAAMLVFTLIILPILCFAAYTGWRHVGVIDPAVWRAYDVVFPLLGVVCMFLVWDVLAAHGSLAGLMNSKQDRVETILQLRGFLIAVWVGGVAVLGWISLMLLRRIKIAAIGATVDQILLRLNMKAGVTAVRATHIKRINKPRGLVIGTAGLLLLVALILAPVPSNKAFADAFLRTSWQISLLGFFLLVRARRFFQVDADSLLAVDRRPPVLFLRSFDDDEKQKFSRSDKALLDFSLETRLSNHFSRFGPFIAIGSPKETVPQLGAARVLLSDDEWQPRVLSWMRDAKLIIMYSGKTHWVNWELRQLVENECATRLILMVPEIKTWRRSKRNEEISARVEHVRQVFKYTPWEEELLKFDDFPGLRAMLFRPDGSMVMIKSRSRSRDSYHLAALIAHQHLLDPDNAAENAAAREQVQRPRRSLVAVGALAGAVLAVLGALYLFRPPGDSRLTFKQGELYYGGPVTQDEARSVGEYLVQRQFFSDDRGSTVQLHQEQGRYRLRFVINSEYAEDPLTALEFGMLGSQIARDVLGGGPIEVGLSDVHLKPIREVPSSAMMMFGKGELYYTEPVTAAEAKAVGELLTQRGFFNFDKATSVYIGQEDGAYQLKFVIDPSRAADPEVKAVFLELSRGIDAEALGGRPVVLHLCDERFRTVQRERL